MKQQQEKGRKIRTAVVGATGYTGVELIRLLIGHPAVEITALTSESYVDQPIGDVFPSVSGLLGITCEKFDPPEIAKVADMIFLALPHKTAMAAAVELLPLGKKVIDLSADFRLRDPEIYRRWYGVDPVAPTLLREADYALPECYRRQVAAAGLGGITSRHPTG